MKIKCFSDPDGELQLITYPEMIPFVGSGIAHDAERVLGDPGTIKRLKFLGADGTINTKTGMITIQLALVVSCITGLLSIALFN